MKIFVKLACKQIFMSDFTSEESPSFCAAQSCKKTPPSAAGSYIEIRR